MRIHSLVYDNFDHQLVEVEVNLHPGLPGIQILGLPDAVVKDCVWRIKSAFLHSGFQWPVASQIIVNLKPSSLRKKGTGLDLAIAAALIWETGQGERLQYGAELPVLYGELDLLGEVHTPPDLIYFQAKDHKVLTGRCTRGLPFGCLSISSLKDLAQPSALPASTENFFCKRPKLKNILIPPKLAEIASVVAAGEHPTLLAGKGGTGKTTIAHIVHSLIEEPSASLVQEYNRYHSHNRIDWRPFRNPHHTTSSLAIIGGGAMALPGELTRAHGGVLLMDEFLEFDPSVQEALREPMEKGVIELIRCTKARTLPARFLLLATSNLCKCGEYEPGWESKCSCGHMRRRRYLERLSGPILDRFAILALSQDWLGKKSVKISAVLLKTEAAIRFRKEVREVHVPNSFISVDSLLEDLSPTARSYFEKEVWSSERRSQHILRVARTYADLDQSKEIKLEHLESARVFAVRNISRLKQASFDRALTLAL